MSRTNNLAQCQRTLQQTMKQICNLYVLNNLMTTHNTTQHMHVTLKHSNKIPVQKLNSAKVKCIRVRVGFPSPM